MDTGAAFQILMNDIRVRLDGEFARNFERKGFFDNKWKDVKKEPGIGSLMLRTEALRSSIKSSIDGNTIKYTSSVPYANVHNEGGVVTKKSGKSFKMPQRQFIGDHPQVDKIIENCAEDFFKEIEILIDHEITNF
jgi:phage gpG-like protein